MNRGELYRVRRPPNDTKPVRTVTIVSRQELVESKFSSVICAPVFSQRRGLETEVPVGIAEGLKHESAILCDSLVSIDKSRLTDFVGALSPDKLFELDAALSVALGLGELRRK